MPPLNPPDDALALENGVFYRITGTNPEGSKLCDEDIVTLESSGWRQDDCSRLHTAKDIAPLLIMPIAKLMPGWQGPLKQMRVGETAQLWVPQALGPDPKGLALKGTLIFDIKIIDASTTDATT